MVAVAGDLQAGIRTGRILSVEPAPESAGLVGDHDLGATELVVSTGGMFYDAGTCRVGAGDYVYYRDGDTLTIAPGLLAAAEDGTPVLSLSPSGRPESRRVANVDLDGFGEPTIEALIPTGEHDYYPIGLRLAESLVAVESDGGYGYVTAGRPLEQPLMDPAGLDPDPEVPAPWDPDGVPPAYSPIPRLIPALGAIVVTFQQVPNADPVDYDLYLSDDPSCPVDSANLAATTPGSTAFLRELPSTGAPLEIEVEYYLRTVARDADGSAPPSDVFPVTITANIDALMGITETNVGELSVSSPLFQGIVAQFVILNAGLITADEAFIEALNAVTFTGTLIQTHNDPQQGVKMAASLPDMPGGGVVGYGGEDTMFSLDANTGKLTAYDADLYGTFRTLAGTSRVQIDYNSVDFYNASAAFAGYVRGYSMGPTGYPALTMASPRDTGMNAAFLSLESSDLTPLARITGALTVTNGLEANSLHLWQGLDVDGAVTFEDMALGGGSSDNLGSRIIRVTDGGRLYAADALPAGMAGGGGGGFVPGSGDLAMGGFDITNVDALNPAGTALSVGGSLTLGGNLGMGGHNINNAGDIAADAITATSLDVTGTGQVSGYNVVADNRVRSLGTLGAWGALGPGAQPATPTNQAGIISILQAYGLCA